MTAKEVGKLMTMIAMAFPSFNPQNKVEMAKAWAFILNPYPANDVLNAFRTYVSTANTAYAPTPSQLIACMDKNASTGQIEASEAWAMVYKAIQKGIYNAKEEFEKFPSAVQKAVGSAEMLQAWAMDEHFNAGVEGALFQKNYNTICEREKQDRMLPKDLIEQANQKYLEG